MTICPGESYHGYSLAGMYVDTFLTIHGCDSIRQLELIVAMPQLDLEAIICNGSSYLGYTSSGVFTDVLPGSQEECDTIRTLTLIVTDMLMSHINASICAGELFEGYTTTGIYIDTFISDAECDSIRTLHLTVHDIATTSLDHSICHGEIYEGYNTDGVFIDTFQAITGCDSIRILNLSVGIIQQVVDATICNGHSYETYTLPGEYVDTIPAIAGLCDTLRTLNLSVASIPWTTIYQVICDGDSYEGYTQTGIYIDTLSSIGGCDSIHEIRLEKLDPIHSMEIVPVCDADISYGLPAGIYIDTLLSIRGCDSVRTITVEGASLYIPNVFSPNDDGINDIFTIPAYPDMDLDMDYFAIFDRYGDMVYKTVSWPVAWKGDDASGDRFQPGVFAYLLIYFCGNQKLVEYGNITLVK
jgi:gliding motility-associated-like protein